MYYLLEEYGDRKPPPGQMIPQHPAVVKIPFKTPSFAGYD